MKEHINKNLLKYLKECDDIELVIGGAVGLKSKQS